MKKKLVYLSLFFFVVNFFFPLFLNADSIVTGFTNKHIQEAIDLEYAKKGGVVTLPEGCYELRNAIYLKSNVQLVGTGESTILKKCPRSSTHVIADIHKGDRKISVKDVSTFKVGDGVSIFSESLKPARIWVTEIIAIEPNAIVLKDALPYDVPLSTKPMVFCSFPCIYCKESNDIAICELVINGNSQNNPVINSWWDSGIGVLDSSHVDIHNVSIIHSPGDGISLNFAHYVNISHSLIESSARLGIHVGSGSQYTYIGNTKILNSGQANIINRDGLYLCFGAVFGLYENNVLQKSQGAGISIGYKDSDNIFQNNIVTKNEIGIFFREDTFETNNLTFLYNDISNNNSSDLQVTKPINNIYMDKWPKRRSIHPSSSFLYYYDSVNNKWDAFSSVK